MSDIPNERLREIVDKTYCLLDEGESMARELLAARAEVERLRNHIDSAGTGFNVALGAIRLSLEQADKDRDALRDDLREAMELLAQVDDGQVPHNTWLDARNALVAKHKVV